MPRALHRAIVAGVAILTPLALEDARRLGRSYGVEIETFEPLALGSVNSNFRAVTADGGRLFARLYEEQGLAGAHAELELLRALSAAGVPVPLSLPRPGGEPVLHEGKPFALFPWVEGEVLCLSRVEPVHCRLLGAALARVHLASQSSRRLGPGRFGPDAMLERLAGVSARAARPDLPELARDAERIRALLEHYRARRDPLLPSGIVHGDLFRDNVLWTNGKIGALLDFESAFHGPFVYDIAVTIAAWCYRDEFDLRLARELALGYAAERPIEAGERRALRVEGALGCLRFATTRITDFSLRTPPGLKPARDYRRFLTRFEAIEAGVLDGILD